MGQEETRCNVSPDEQATDEGLTCTQGPRRRNHEQLILAEIHEGQQRPAGNRVESPT